MSMFLDSHIKLIAEAFPSLGYTWLKKDFILVFGYKGTTLWLCIAYDRAEDFTLNIETHISRQVIYRQKFNNLQDLIDQLQTIVSYMRLIERDVRDDLWDLPYKLWNIRNESI